MFQRSFLRINKTGPCRNFAQQCEASGQVIADYLTGTDKGIVSIGFNNNKTKNALGKALTESLSCFVNDISNNSSARVVIFRSMLPKVFCAGADLKERRNMSDNEVKSYVTYLRNLMFKIENIHIPTIAAIDGAALGGGLELALSCDIRVASESAKLGLVETRLGILPGAGGTQRLPRLLGASVAKELIFTSRILNGKESKELGLVNHCAPDNNDSNAAYMKSLEIAREILSNGPIGIQLAKMAINKGIEVDINQGCAIEELCYAQVIPTKDRLEGLKAFQEKRKPVYVGE